MIPRRMVRIRGVDRKQEEEHIGGRWPDNLLQCIRVETPGAKRQSQGVSNQAVELMAGVATIP